MSTMINTQVSFEFPSSIPAIPASQSRVETTTTPKARSTGRQVDNLDMPAGSSLDQAEESAQASAENQAVIVEFAKDFGVIDRRVVFQVSPETGDLTIQVVDRETGDVVRQIPPEEVVAFAQRFREMLGILIDEKF